MKECCKTGDPEPRKPKQNWLKWLLYLVLLLALGLVFYEQFTT